MTLNSRRQFLRQTSLGAAALYGNHATVLGAAVRAFKDCAQDPHTDASLIRKFSSQIAGQVITPEMSDYESSRLVFNRAFDRHPAMIVRCTNASDVARSLDFAQAHRLPLAVRAGGHSRLGYGMCDGGVVIDF